MGRLHRSFFSRKIHKLDNKSFLKNNSFLVIVRLFSAAMSLIALKLTYNVLDSADFGFFNFILFVLAISTAVASPINRLFWAENSEESFVGAVVFTTAIAFLAFFVIFFYTFINNNSIYGSIYMLPAIFAYIFCKISERYIYGQVIFDQNILKAIPITIIMVCCEVLVTYFQYYFDSSSMYIRILLPSLLSMIVLLSISVYRNYLLTIFKGLFSTYAIFLYSKNAIICSVGIKIILLTVLSTFAVMLDRLILVMSPSTQQSNAADYLLALSYAIAIQSLFNVILDVGRKKVFQKMNWVPGARKFVCNGLSVIVISTAGLIILYPLLGYISVLPGSISLLVWITLLVRGSINSIINLSYLDSVQKGKIIDVILPTFLMIFVNLVFIYSTFFGQQHILLNFAVLLAMLVIGAYSVLQFYRRSPTELK